jgi:hypothetical protein
MATVKKPAKKMQMGGGTKPMMKKGGSFPDLNKDGKITKADILKGRGVIAKKGMKVKKAQNGDKLKKNPIKEQMNWVEEQKSKPRSSSKYMTNPIKQQMDWQKEQKEKQYNFNLDKLKRDKRYDSTRSMEKVKAVEKKTVGKPNYKKGGKMTKKCLYGCK